VRINTPLARQEEGSCARGRQSPPPVSQITYCDERFSDAIFALGPHIRYIAYGSGQTIVLSQHERVLAASVAASDFSKNCWSTRAAHDCLPTRQSRLRRVTMWQSSCIPQAISGTKHCLDYAVEVGTPASHCTRATKNKIIVMRPEMVARIAAGLDHSPLFSCCHRRVTNIICSFCHLCCRR
jgi:hypothetical protein